MSVTGSHYLLVRPVYIFGTDGPNDDDATKTQSLPVGAMGNASVEFTAPVWTGDEEKDVAYWYVGVFQSGTEKATMLLRRMSLKIVQDCVAVEYSDFSVAAEEDFYRLSVGGGLHFDDGEIWTQFLWLSELHHNGKNFTTHDVMKRHESQNHGNCAKDYPDAVVGGTMELLLTNLNGELQGKKWNHNI